MTSSYSPSAKCTLLVPTPLAHKQNLHHLMLIITDPINIPPPSVIVTPLNTYFDDCDQTCILNVNEHSFITHKSFINFKESRIREVTKLEKGVQVGLFKIKDDLCNELYKKICDGFETSTAMDTLIKGIYKRFKREKESETITKIEQVLSSPL